MHAGSSKLKRVYGPETDPARDRREYGRMDLPATALAVDTEGNDLGRVEEISGGGMMLRPASPYARLALKVGQRMTIVVTEPGNGNTTILPVEVRYVRSNTVGLRFL